MKGFTRREVAAGLAAAAVMAKAGDVGAQSGYPNRPITLICPWGAGGGTDAAARIVASLLERELGQPVNVVNRTGGSGVVGHAAIASAPADGYTIGIVTVEIGMMHWQGLTQLRSGDFTALAIINEDQPGLQVRADAPYKTVGDLAEAIKAAPSGRLKASGTGQGGIWHVALAGWLQTLGLKPNHVTWVPSNGAAGGMQELVSGGVDIVPCSVPEARAMLDAGRARSLAVMSPTRIASFPNVPTLKETTGSDYTLGVWRGIAGPKGLPPETAARLIAALEKVYGSSGYKEFMDSRGFGMSWAAGDAATRFMAGVDTRMGDVMKAAGLAKA